MRPGKTRKRVESGPGRREYCRFHPGGRFYVKVSAVDTATYTEVSIVGDPMRDKSAR